MSLTPYALLASLVMTGCTSPKSSGVCASASLLSSVPADGDTLVMPTDSLQFQFDGPVDAPEIWLDGGGGDGWQPLDPGPDDAWTFTPDAPLAHGTQYTATLQTCAQDAGQLGFTTLPPTVGDSVVDHTYAFDLLDAGLVWIEPAAPPPALMLESVLADTTSVLLMPTGVNGDTIDLLVALGEADAAGLVQHSCVGATQVAELDFSRDPYLALEPLDITVIDGDAPFKLTQTSLDGVFIDGGAALRDLHLRGQADVRQLAANEEYDLCGIFADLYGATCLPCAGQTDEEQPYCLLLEAIAPTAALIPDLQLDPALTPGEGC